MKKAIATLYNINTNGVQHNRVFANPVKRPIMPINTKPVTTIILYIAAGNVKIEFSPNRLRNIDIISYFRPCLKISSNKTEQQYCANNTDKPQCSKNIS